MTKIEEVEEIFYQLLNVVQIYQNGQEVIVKSFDRTRNKEILAPFESFEDESLFPDKAKNLKRLKLYAAYMNYIGAFDVGEDRPNCKFNYFLDIIEEKLNATIIYHKIPADETNWSNFHNTRDKWIRKLIKEEKLDFFLNHGNQKFNLETYNNVEFCFIAPWPKSYSITELILILPLDASCWTWLLITIAISTILWRLSEGHWNFLFGAFALFVGQETKVQT